MAQIQILVGSSGGTAEKTALGVAAVLNHQGHTVRVNSEPRSADLAQNPDEVLLICTSTTGQGELPRNIYPLYLALDDRAVDLSGRSYGVISLGDSGYQYFAQAGYMLEDVFYASGARRVGDIFTLDARKVRNHPLEAAQWANQWVELLSA